MEKKLTADQIIHKQLGFSPDDNWVFQSGVRSSMQEYASQECSSKDEEIKRLVAQRGKSNRWFKDWRKIMDAVVPPGPFCRDCADEDGICPSDNLPCDPTDRVIKIFQSKDERIKELEELSKENRDLLLRCHTLLYTEKHLYHTDIFDRLKTQIDKTISLIAPDTDNLIKN